jgi:hypothetical protein
MQVTKTPSIQSSGSETKVTSITSKINELNTSGLLTSITSYSSSSRSVSETTSTQISEVQKFITNPGDYISTHSDSANNDSSLELINAILNGGTIGEVAEIMSQVSPSMSEEYLENCKTMINQMNSSTGRSAMQSADIKNVKLRFADSIPSRAAFAADLNWDTIYWYYGMCGVTVAGLSAYRWCGWWQPWVGVAGLATAAAGGASMATQLGIWYACTDFRSWADSLIGRDSTTARAILNSENGLKILGISTASAGVVVFAYVNITETLPLFIGRSVPLFRVFGLSTQGVNDSRFQAIFHAV